MKSAWLALALSFASFTQASAADVPRDLQEGFGEGLSDEEREAVGKWLHQTVQDHEIAEQYKATVEMHLLNMIDLTRAGDLMGAYDEAYALNKLKRDMKAAQGKAVDRGWFGAIGGAWDLIKAVIAGDMGAIGKAVLKILWNLVF